MKQDFSPRLAISSCSGKASVASRDQRKGFRVALLCLLIIGGTTGSSASPAAVYAQGKAVRQPAKAPVKVDHSAALNSYWNRLRQRVQNNWLIPDGKNHIVLTANIQADGSVGDVTVTSNPANQQAEQTCTDAFSKSQPLEPLPQGIAAAKVTITFDYNYDPHGDGSSRLYGMIVPVAQGQAQQTTSPPETPK
ncbi:MAG TPA: TonB C-terminal domain-containing protein [Candidatus Obscuribacterales bacterium]